jgi:hypothetical protein
VSVHEGIASRTYQCCHTARPNDAKFSTYLLHVQHYTMHKIRCKTCRNKMLICSCGVPSKSYSRVTGWHACHRFAIHVLEDITLHNHRCKNLKSWILITFVRTCTYWKEIWRTEVLTFLHTRGNCERVGVFNLYLHKEIDEHRKLSKLVHTWRRLLIRSIVQVCTHIKGPLSTVRICTFGRK